VSNISKNIQTLFLADLNLVNNENYFDLISGKKIQKEQQNLQINPYQTIWISNQNN
jgi:sucrose phosphorylase